MLMYKTVYWIPVGGLHMMDESLLHGWGFSELIVAVKNNRTVPCKCKGESLKERCYLLQISVIIW